MYKCMVTNYADLTSGCQKEVGRAVHMAFYVWQEGALITSDCDDDIKQYCLAVRPNMANRPGAVGSCLASIVSDGGAGVKTGPSCAYLLRVRISTDLFLRVLWILLQGNRIVNFPTKHTAPGSSGYFSRSPL